MRAVVLGALLLVSVGVAALEPAKVQGQFTREGKSYTVTHGVAWQAARPDTLVLVLTDTEVPLMDVRHTTQLQKLAEEGKVHGLRFEFDPAHLDLRWVSGRYMTPEWATYRGGMGTSWQKLEVANGHLAGKLDAGGVQVEFDIPIVGAVSPKILTGEEAQHAQQAELLLAYEDQVRKGSWQGAAKLLTPLSAEALKKDVGTKEGLGQFQTAGKYMREFLSKGEARRQEIQQVVIGAEDAAVMGSGFASDFVLIGGKWLKI